VLPFLVSLMDVPFKRDVVEAIRAASKQPTPEEMEQQIEEEKRNAVILAGLEQKAREIDLKERKMDSEVRGIDANTVLTLIQAMFSSMQGGAQV
ncbi:hypothetical protein ACWTQY_32650, partial [Klebsiella pneumoniae]